MKAEEYNALYTTTVTMERDKDEYWGYWKTCDTCKNSMRASAIYCPTCGRRITRHDAGKE
jgi:predicted RNA-binding Zn-ribbon protein involved in translation (DUF1610 family)